MFDICNQKLQINNSEKINVLLSAYRELHAHIRASEDSENKIAFAISAFLVIICGFVMQGHLSGAVTFDIRIYVTIFISFITILTIYFLSKNNKRTNWQKKTIVKIEIALNLHAPGFFYHYMTSNDGHIMPVLENADKWGNSDERGSLYPHIFGLVISFIASLTIVWLVPYHSSEVSNDSNIPSISPPNNNHLPGWTLVKSSFSPLHPAKLPALIEDATGLRPLPSWWCQTPHILLIPAPSAHRWPWLRA